MLRKFFNGIIILSVLALFSGCSNDLKEEEQPKKKIVTESSSGKIIDSDSNNTIEGADSILLGEPFLLTINPDGDKDWYKVDLPARGYLKIESGETPEEIDLEVRFANYDQWGDSKEKIVRDWHRVPDSCAFLEKGTYYFVIAESYNDDSSKQKIEVKAEFISEFDPLEPNDSPEDAAKVSLGKVETVALYPTGDNDWFKVKPGKQGYLDVKVKSIKGGINPEVRYALYDQWADPKIKIVRRWKKLPDACWVEADKEYYIQLHDDYDEDSSEKAFQVKFDFREEMDSFEPNDTFKKAKELPLNKPFSAAIYPSGDQDYFKVIGPESGKLKIGTKGVSSEIKLEAKFFILGDESSKLESKSEWKDLPAEFDLYPGKRYYLLIHDDYDEDSSPETFELKVDDFSKDSTLENSPQ